MPQVIRLWPLVTPQNPTAQTTAGNAAEVGLASKAPQCQKGGGASKKVRDNKDTVAIPAATTAAQQRLPELPLEASMNMA